MEMTSALCRCGQSLLRRGTPAQRERWAAPVLSFARIGCWALTEPEAGSDAFSLRTAARRLPDGGFSLSGEKSFITNAPIADVLVVYARINGAPNDGEIRPFVLERSDPGVSTSAPLDKMGMRASPTGSIHLDEVRVPADRLLGDPEESGKRTAIETLLGERAGLAGMGLAIVEESLQLATGYAKERRQFGQPIAQFQAVQLRLARMYAAQETVRALLDRGRALAGSGEASLAYFCAAKYTSSTLATECALDAVQILGGYGYLRDFPAERPIIASKALRATRSCSKSAAARATSSCSRWRASCSGSFPWQDGQGDAGDDRSAAEDEASSWPFAQERDSAGGGERRNRDLQDGGRRQAQMRHRGVPEAVAEAGCERARSDGQTGAGR